MMMLFIILHYGRIKMRVWRCLKIGHWVVRFQTGHQMFCKLKIWRMFTSYCRHGTITLLIAIKFFICFLYLVPLGKFDEFARETLKKSLPIVSLPEIKNATLFDYYIDCQHGQFLSWDERPVDKFRQSTPAFVWVPEVISMKIYLLCSMWIFLLLCGYFCFYVDIFASMWIFLLLFYNRLFIT